MSTIEIILTAALVSTNCVWIWLLSTAQRNNAAALDMLEQMLNESRPEAPSSEEGS